ncbi:MAG: hypothetical protein JW902_11985, partial [Syntrophaceae bacterium]|nr:hypothetical protein [Syntrophaceae bacterium]
MKSRKPKVESKTGIKFETRNPKSQTNSKSECSKFKTKSKTTEYTEKKIQLGEFAIFQTRIRDDEKGINRLMAGS